MRQSDQPAYPCEGPNELYPGLTIRQQAVLMAMQGLAGNCEYDNELWGRDIANDAVMLADACLKAERDSR